MTEDLEAAEVDVPEVDVREGRGYTVSSFVMAAVAVAVLPPLLGGIGAVLGYVGLRKGDPRGRAAMVCSLVAIVVGSLLAMAVYEAVT